MVRNVIKYPDKILRKKSNNVEHFDEKLHSLLDDMNETMRDHKGIGLAAIQVGVPKKVFIINLVNDDEESDEIYAPELFEFINPTIISSNGLFANSEGCLSVPGIYEEIERFEELKIKYQDRNGKEHQKTIDGILSIAFQHEYDHLEGKLFVDKFSYLKRKKFDKEWKKGIKRSD